MTLLSATISNISIFVPNFTLYPDYVKQLRDLTDIPFDFHFMIEKPEERLQWFDIREGDYAAVHYESTKHIAKCLQYLRSIGAKPILAINPGTPICVVEEAVDFIDGVLVMLSLIHISEPTRPY